MKSSLAMGQEQDTVAVGQGEGREVVDPLLPCTIPRPRSRSLALSYVLSQTLDAVSSSPPHAAMVGVALLLG